MQRQPRHRHQEVAKNPHPAPTAPPSPAQERVGGIKKAPDLPGLLLNSVHRNPHACGCGSRPPPASGRGRGLPAFGTAEERGVDGSITDSRFGFLPFRRSLISSPVNVSNSSRPDPDLADRLHQRIRAAVLDGTLSESRIEQSYRRIMALKAELTAPVAKAASAH
mgnify:CR=1 FL=1